MEPSQRLAANALLRHGTEAARILETMPPALCAELLTQVATREAPTVHLLGRLAPHYAALVLRELAEAQQLEALQALPTATAAQLLRRLPREVRDQLASKLPARLVRRLTLLLRPGQATAGALADPDAFVLFDHMTVKAILKAHRDALIASLHDIPVVDDQHNFVGLVTPKALLVADGSDLVGSVTRRGVPRLGAAAGLSKIAASGGWRTHYALPVVEASGAFVGMLTYASLRWVEQQLTAGVRSEQPSAARALGDLFSTAMGGMFEAMASGSESEGGNRGP